MMDVDVEVRCNAGYAEVTPGAGELPQRLPAAGVGHAGRDDRAGDPQAAPGHVLPGVPGAPAAGGAGAGLGGRDQLPAGRVDQAGGKAGCLAGGTSLSKSQVSLMAADLDEMVEGSAPGSWIPGRTAPMDRRADPEGPRGRLDGERARPDRHRRQRRRRAGDPGHRRRLVPGRRRVVGVPARTGRPRPVRRAARHLRLPPGPARRDRLGAARSGLAALPDPLPSQSAHPRPRRPSRGCPPWCGPSSSSRTPPPSAPSTPRLWPRWRRSSRPPRRTWTTP